MKFEFKVGQRFLLSRRSKMLAVVSLITILGVAFGVMSLLLTLAVIQGFEAEYKRSVLSFNAHVLVMQGDSIEDVPEVIKGIKKVGQHIDIKGISPFSYREGLVVKGHLVRGIALKLVDLTDYWKLSGMDHERVSLSPGEANRSPGGLWVGKVLWEELGEERGKLRLRLPEKESETTSFRELPVEGRFSTGMYDYDAAFALVDRQVAREYLAGDTNLTGVEIWLQDPDQAQIFTSRLSETLPFPYTVLSWQDLNAHLFGALKLERFVFSLIMGILIMVASFNISGTLTMRILEKRGDIAILRAMGATWGQLRRLFFLQGLVLGWVGCGVGIALGGLVIEIIDRYKPVKLAADIYFVEFVPVSWQFKHILAVFVVTTFFAWGATRLALMRLRRFSVSEALGEV